MAKKIIHVAIDVTVIEMLDRCVAWHKKDDVEGEKEITRTWLIAKWVKEEHARLYGSIPVERNLPDLVTNQKGPKESLNVLVDETVIDMLGQCVDWYKAHAGNRRSSRPALITGLIQDGYKRLYRKEKIELGSHDLYILNPEKRSEAVHYLTDFRKHDMVIDEQVVSYVADKFGGFSAPREDA
ncbi:hypothetical protein ACTHPH_21665 [Paenibacillus pasadenensis]|uniref:hypothetical protein n=1 Tax=Paenibacillus pasadenensis TaxID=217090 RepID=UPI00048E4704|nr:hypothetical protein [Paenibacillus pasadenensis]